MTEEYYYIEEIKTNTSDPKMNKTNNFNERNSEQLKMIGSVHSIGNKKSQEMRLHEMEQQLKMAESRCSTLKGQVDYMKMLYNGMTSADNKTAKINSKSSNSVAKRQLNLDANNMKRKHDKSSETGNTAKGAKYSSKNGELWKEVPSRDVGLKLELSNITTIPHLDVNTKSVNTAVKSINNIITGITNSVNRLTQLQVHVGCSNSSQSQEDPIGIRTITCCPRDINQNIEAEKPYQLDTNEIPIKQSVASIKSKLFKKLSKKKLKGAANKQNSVGSIGEHKKKIRITARHVEKKTKLNHASITAGTDALQLTIGKNKNKTIGKLNTLSTILTKKSYVNDKTASKIERHNCKSELIELYHNSAAKIITGSEDSLPANKSDARPKVAQHITQENIPIVYENYRQPLSPIEEQQTVYGSYYKNYELPTIASKMKQVAKAYFENFSFRTIPFVTAKSITPSHNLGVNIQQVLSIIKGRKPVSGISPTLAYNIELAANKLGSRPLSALVSTLGSRMTTRMPCPLTRGLRNFAQLQELAKNIPEETAEEIAASVDGDGSKVESVLGAGDKEAENVWVVDSESRKEQCTCLPKQGTHFRDVYNKYAYKEKLRDSANFGAPKRIRSKPWNTNQRYKTSIYDLQVRKSNEFHKREKNLKEILKNLHDEFAFMNVQYEELKNQVNKETKTDDNLMQALEKLEKELQNKEDEITMVMTLYKEVINLKQQVKVLRKRASQSSVAPSFIRQQNFKDLSAAGHLTKLLRHIQQFQETLKNKSTM